MTKRQCNTRDFIDLVIANHRANPVEHCIIWPFSESHKYARITWKGKALYAHRIINIEINGEPEPGLQSAHDCGTPKCVNPSHLRWASAKANNADKKKHGTHAVGESTNNNKLNESQVREIRKLRKSGLTYRAIAKRFDVHLANIAYICTNKTWTHLESEV